MHKMEKQFYVYILASAKYGTLYIGVTSDLLKRIWQHKNKVIEGFTSCYNTSLLVYLEAHENAENAIKREKRLKFWLRDWKIALIEQNNPDWHDLYGDIGGDPLCGAMDPAVKPQDDAVSKMNEI